MVKACTEIYCIYLMPNVNVYMCKCVYKKSIGHCSFFLWFYVTGQVLVIVVAVALLNPTEKYIYFFIFFFL